MSKTIQLKKYELPILIQNEPEGGFTAICPLWTDCYAQSETKEHVIDEITKVANALIALYDEENLKIPLKRITTPLTSYPNNSFVFPIVLHAA